MVTHENNLFVFVFLHGIYVLHIYLEQKLKLIISSVALFLGLIFLFVTFLKI